MSATLKGDLTKRMRRGEKRAERAVHGTAENIKAGASGRAPRDTNHLADDSIRVERIDEHQAVVIVQTADEKHPEYSRFVEQGTRHQAAQPFLIPAAEAERGPFIQRIRKAYEQ